MDKEQIEEAISKDRVVLFMKGDRLFPQCGFSGRVIKILEQHNVDYKEYDVMSNAALRENIKEYSDWPTIPQLYVDGEFIGGSDIVYDMNRDGELTEVLEVTSENQ
ncbi:hypothetical protein LCGC14_2365930 [marine sediment metagenome]|uniref:Glutaredoxin domain-containing protein n=1 Tax=marine sediment metagenome TaxID=412755 RepID=A0A0F9C5G1_9ZZZZ